jgi:beta-barrel assembly-enhancing protease
VLISAGPFFFCLKEVFVRLSLFVVVLCLSGCAPLISAPRPNDQVQAMVDANAMMMLMMQARTDAESSCAWLRTREVSWEEERFIGEELAVTITSDTGHLWLDGATEKDPEALNKTLAERRPLTLPEGSKNTLTAHVAVVGRNLAHFSSRPSLAWVFGVVENETPRSFSAPGGYVFVTTGLLKKMSNEAQLAGVLSHEIGHVVQKNGLRKYLEAEHAQCVAATTAQYLATHGQRSPATDELARWAKQFTPTADRQNRDPAFSNFILKMVSTLSQLGNEQEIEFETDKAALELLAFAGYDAVEYERFLTSWPQSHHPAAEARVAKLKALREGELADFVHGTAKPSLDSVFAPLKP